MHTTIQGTYGLRKLFTITFWVVFIKGLLQVFIKNEVKGIKKGVNHRPKFLTPRTLETSKIETHIEVGWNEQLVYTSNYRT